MKFFVFIILVLGLSISQPALATDPLAGSLSVGDKAKDFILPDAYKYPVNLYDELKKGPVVLSFYRGGWCPICNAQLHTYQERLEDIHATGAQLIAVSPETPAHAEVTAIKNQLTYTVLSDHGNQVAKIYGIVWEIPKDQQEEYNKWLVDTTKFSLQQFNDSEGFKIPVPATFVIDKNGKIVYAFKDVDYKKRADIEDILKVLKQLK